MKKPVWKRLLTGAFITILAVAVLAVLCLKFLESRISANFTSPPLHQSLPQQNYDFKYASLDGAKHNLSQLKGKVVFVNFWGTWCIRCVAEMPTIQTLYNDLKNDPAIAFVIASRLDTPQRIHLYARYGHYDLPFYMVSDADIPQAMVFNQYPTTFIFAKDGSLAERQIGGADWSSPSVIQFIRQLENK